MLFDGSYWILNSAIGSTLENLIFMRNQMQAHRHYTYIISNIKDNKHYIGSRTCKGSSTPETDLGFKYFGTPITNSWLIQDQKVNPQNYTYQIINKYQLRKEAIWNEICLHKIFDVGVNPDFYNGSRATSTGFSQAGTTRSDDHKAKISKALIGNKHSDETKAKISKSLSGENHPRFGKFGENNPLFGKTHSDESKAKMSLSSSGENCSQETRRKMSEAHKGKPKSNESKAKMSEAKTGTTQSDSHKAKLSKIRAGKIFINDKTKNKIIKPEQLPEYESLGWVKGKIKANF